MKYILQVSLQWLADSTQLSSKIVLVLADIAFPLLPPWITSMLFTNGLTDSTLKLLTLIMVSRSRLLVRVPSEHVVFIGGWSFRVSYQMRKHQISPPHSTVLHRVVVFVNAMFHNANVLNPKLNGWGNFVINLPYIANIIILIAIVGALGIPYGKFCV